MAELKIYLTNELNERFRRAAMSVYGYGRGSLSRAAEEAFAKWCSEHESLHLPEKAVGNPESPRDQLSKEEESHVDPEEREGVNHQTSGIGDDKALKPTGSSV